MDASDRAAPESRLADGWSPAGRARRSNSFLALLGLPAFGLTFAVTAISTYLPVVVTSLGGPIVAGMLVGGEGLFGLFLPIVIGARSDQHSRRVADRFSYIRVAAISSVLALVGLGIVAPGTHSVLLVALVIAVFYIGYYLYLAPYWALYPDLVPNEQSGRSRSAESTWRLLGSGGALVAGGLLLGLGEAVPFLAAAALLGGATVVFERTLAGVRGLPVRHTAVSEKASLATARATLSNKRLRLFLFVVTLWNVGLSGIRAFVVLFFVAGLGRSTHFVSLVVFPLAAVGFVMAPLSGRLADRHGHRRIVLIATAVYGLGLLLPLFTLSAGVLLTVPVVAAGAATVSTLEYSVLMRMVEHEGHGAVAGVYGFFRGLGSTLGPVLAGLAIVGGRTLFPSSHGYAAMWFVVGVAILLSLPLLRTIPGDDF